MRETGRYHGEYVVSIVIEEVKNPRDSSGRDAILLQLMRSSEWMCGDRYLLNSRGHALDELVPRYSKPPSSNQLLPLTDDTPDIKLHQGAFPSVWFNFKCFLLLPLDRTLAHERWGDVMHVSFTFSAFFWAFLLSMYNLSSGGITYSGGIGAGSSITGKGGSWSNNRRF